MFFLSSILSGRHKYTVKKNHFSCSVLLLLKLLAKDFSSFVKLKYVCSCLLPLRLTTLFPNFNCVMFIQFIFPESLYWLGHIYIYICYYEDYKRNYAS